MDLFSTNILNAVVGDLKQPGKTWLLDRYFPTMQTEQTEEIHFDVDDGKRRVAPFVSPVVAGKVVQSKGYTTKTFKPAYVKDKRIFDPSRPFKRTMGEQVGGVLSPADRLRALLAYELQDQIGMLNRRMEVMAAEVIRTGKSTIVGDQYAQVVVDFVRDATLTPAALSGTARWGQSAAAPLDNLQTWATLVLQKSGSQPVDVILDVDAWVAFRKDPTVVTRLNQWRNTAVNLAQDAVVSEGGTLMGVIDQFNIYVYAGWYVDPATGTEGPILPSGTVIMTGPAVGGSGPDGVRAFGAIKDEEAGFQAVPYFSKSWIEKDPAVRYLMLQSAPLMVPHRPNATLSPAGVL